MEEMFALHASKNQTKEKIKFLKKSFLFSSWSMDQLVKLAYSMKRKEFARGHVLAKQVREYLQGAVSGLHKLT